jgi:hypothetical protein
MFATMYLTEPPTEARSLLEVDDAAIGQQQVAVRPEREPLPDDEVAEAGHDEDEQQHQEEPHVELRRELPHVPAIVDLLVAREGDELLDVAVDLFMRHGSSP